MGMGMGMREGGSGDGKGGIFQGALAEGMFCERSECLCDLMNCV